MKLTNAQQREKENLEWFNPDLFKQFPPHKGEHEEYLVHSERGALISGFQHGKERFNVYSEAKRRRGITIHELWEDSFYSRDGSWTGFVGLLTEEDGSLIPEHIKNYIKKEIFAGQDADKIDRIYEELKIMDVINL